MNRPFDYVHDITHSYGRILFPWFGGWLGYSERKYFCLMRAFHNCRATGVY